MKLARASFPGPCRRLPVCYLAVILVLALSVLCFILTSPLPRPLKASAVRCVKFAPEGQTREGIGALLRRNQLGLFIADTYAARVAFPNIESEHGYDVRDMFDECPDPAPGCTLREDAMYLERCPRRDCRCHREQLYRHSDALAGRCPVLGYVNMKVRTMEFSGCTARTLARYFGTERAPAVPYDALHFRAGDISGRKGGKTFSPHELFYLLRAMCQLSDRDVVVCTEGTPDIPIPPECGNRLVLASDTSIQDVFRIFQHATTVSVGTSSLATIVMEIARPERVVMIERALPKFEFVDCERWTVIGRYGAVFHFNSKKLMVQSALSGQPLMVRSLRTDNQHAGTKFILGVPERRWTNDTKMRWTRTRDSR